MATILEMAHITKEFPGVKALDDVTFRLKRVKFTLLSVKMVRVNQLL